MNSKFFLLFAIIIFVFVNFYVFGKEKKEIRASEVLHIYKDSSSWMHSVSLKLCVKIKGIENGLDLNPYELDLIIRHDGGNSEWIGHISGYDDKGEPDPENKHIINRIMAGGRSLSVLGQAGKAPLAAQISKNYKDHQKDLLEHPEYGSPLWGIIFGNNHNSVSNLLSEAANLKLRDKQENINGILCYVLEAKTKYGKVTAWVAPEKGYNALKWEIHKDSQDLYDKTPINDMNLDSWSAVFEAVDFLQVGDAFIPKRGTFIHRKEKKDGSIFIFRSEYTTEDVQLHPDFDALGAFKFNIPNGTPVYFEEAPGIRYTWQNGKMIPNVDKYIIEEIYKITEEIIDKGEIPSALVTAKKPELAPNEPDVNVSIQPEVDVNVVEAHREVPESFTSSLILKLILIGLFIIIGVIVWLVLCQLKA